MKRGRASNRILDFYLGIPVLNLLATFRRRGELPRDPERVGILLNPALGDTLLASAALQDVRALYPHAHLILFAGPTNIHAARLLPVVDAVETIPFNRPWKAAHIIRRTHLDLMLDFTAWQRVSAFLSLVSGASCRVGFRRSGQHRQRAYDLTVPHRGDCHELENLRRLTGHLGSRIHAEPSLIIPDGPVPPEVMRVERVVLLHPWASGARSWLREWPQAHWVELACALSATSSGTRNSDQPAPEFFLTGSPAEAHRCEELRAALAQRGISAHALIGRDGLAGVARVLRRAELLISVNTGIMHLGAILGTPTVSLNGPTSRHRWGPLGPHVRNVGPHDGSGGYLDLGFEFPSNPADVMARITVEDVVEAARQLTPLAPSSPHLADATSSPSESD